MNPVNSCKGVMLLFQVQVRNVTNAQGGYEFKAPISGQTTQRINEIPPENFRQMITGLMPGHHYEVKVTATNNEGTSEALKGVIIKTKEGRITYSIRVVSLYNATCRVLRDDFKSSKNHFTNRHRPR